MSKNKEQLLFDKINIIGLGLMGGSIAKSCKQHNVAGSVSGFDNSQTTLDYALKNKIIDQEFKFEVGFIKNNLTIIASPLSTYQEIFWQLKSKISNGIVIDIGSLKFFINNLAKEILVDEVGNFIACHPIAGSQKSGIGNADMNLFLGKKVIISKIKDNKREQLDKIKLFWQRIGSDIEFIDAKNHDKIFALVSHLPQFLAFIAKEEYENGGDEILNKHFRLQNSSLKIWNEIFALNKNNIGFYLKDLLKNVELMIESLSKNQFQEILNNHPIADFTNQNNIYPRNPFDKNQFQNKQLPPKRILLKRILLTLCFLQLTDVQKFYNHSGSGFRDFTAIAVYQKFLSQNLLEDEKPFLIEFLSQIKSRIYEFK